MRVILFNKNFLKKDKIKLIQERIEKCNPRFFELFEILKRFLGIYDKYSRNWMEQSLILEGKLTIRQLSQKFKSIKEEAFQEILNGDNSISSLILFIKISFKYFNCSNNYKSLNKIKIRYFRKELEFLKSRFKDASRY